MKLIKSIKRPTINQAMNIELNYISQDSLQSVALTTTFLTLETVLLAFLNVP